MMRYRHQAVVLCGHLHKYSFLVRRTDAGRFVQLAISSVAATSDGRPRGELRGIDHYGPELVDLEPRHAPDTGQARRDLLAAERPFIEHFEYADAWGHGQIRVGPAQLQADICCGLDAHPWRRLNVSSYF